MNAAGTLIVAFTGWSSKRSSFHLQILVLKIFFSQLSMHAVSDAWITYISPGVSMHSLGFDSKVQQPPSTTFANMAIRTSGNVIGMLVMLPVAVMVVVGWTWFATVKVLVGCTCQSGGRGRKRVGVGVEVEVWSAFAKTKTTQRRVFYKKNGLFLILGKSKLPDRIFSYFLHIWYGYTVPTSF